jgi:hypothetical protein
MALTRYGQASLLVGHWSSAERRWIEASRAAELGGVASCRCSCCGGDDCRNVSSISQPEIMSLGPLPNRSPNVKRRSLFCTVAYNAASHVIRMQDGGGWRAVRPRQRREASRCACALPPWVGGTFRFEILIQPSYPKIWREISLAVRKGTSAEVSWPVTSWGKLLAA